MFSSIFLLIRGLNKIISTLTPMRPSSHTLKHSHRHTASKHSHRRTTLTSKGLPQRYEDRAILKWLHSITLDTNMPPPFTTTMTQQAIRKTKNTSATGPDGISYLHLKHLGPHVIRALTDIFNFSLRTNSIHNICKLAKIIPILKPNKSATEPASYRPISLLCNPFKIIERLVLNISHTSTYLPHNTTSDHNTLHP